MTVSIAPGPIRGEVVALPSKSHLHRLLICAGLSRGESTLLRAGADGVDVQATVHCLQALGAQIWSQEQGFLVRPINRETKDSSTPVELNCRESGSTLRFLLPVVCALGVRGAFRMEGRLAQRPMEPLLEELRAKGCKLEQRGDMLQFEGALQSGVFSLPGNISSQFISGLLFALPLLEGDSRIQITGAMESVSYVDMTLAALRQFGVAIHRCEDGFEIPGGQLGRSPGIIQAQGDWSNGALWLFAGAMPGGQIQCRGLSAQSAQGDRQAQVLLQQLGAQVSWQADALLVSEGARRGIEVDASNIPDLIPALAAVAAVSEGITVIRNAARLRLKESDRLVAVTQTLNSLGAHITIHGDSLRIEGRVQLDGGRVDALGDHRIAMMAALVSAACRAPVVVTGAQAVEKSDPQFWSTLENLGKIVKEEVRL